MKALFDRVLEIDPQLVEQRDVLLQLRFEARKARGKVVLEPWLDLTGDLGHGGVHLPQEGVLTRSTANGQRDETAEKMSCHAKAAKAPLDPSLKGHRCAVLR